MLNLLDFTDDGRGRPYSAPAVMAGDRPPSGTPESEASVMEYFTNKGETQAGVTNPRIPRSGLGSRFSVDQVGGLRSSAAAVNALTAIGKAPRTHHADPLPASGVTAGGSISGDEEEGPASLVKMSDAEIYKESLRRYRTDTTPKVGALATTAEAPLLPDEHNNVLHSSAEPSTTAAAMPPVGLFSRLAQSHQRSIDSKSSALRAAKTHATIAAEQQRHLERRSEAAVTMQRAVRQLLIGSRGVRLLALLHLLQTEVVAPRFPLIVGRTLSVQGGIDASHPVIVVTPMLYLLEVVLEYEYCLYVENVSRRLVADSTNADGMASRAGGHMRKYTRLSMLSSAEMSDLHDTVQQRLASGEVVVSRYQLHRGVSSLVTREGEAMWSSRLVDAIAHRASNGLSRESFLHTIAQDVVLRPPRDLVTGDDASTTSAGRPATPTWSYHSGTTASQHHSGSATHSSSSNASAAPLLQREVLVDRDADASWEYPQTTADLKWKQQQLRTAAASRTAVIPVDGEGAVAALIQATPVTWFAGGPVVAGSTAPDLSVMPPLAATHPTRSGAVSAPASTSTESIESQLASLWAGQDPELAPQERRSKRLARRRILGAEDDGVGSSDDDVEGNSAAATRAVAFTEPAQLEFDSAAQRLDRDRRERELKKRVEVAVATSVALRLQHQQAHFDPSSWGLDGSAASVQQAALVMSVAMDANSRPASRSSTATDASLRQVHRVVVRVGGGGAQAGQPQECVICEMDAVGVQRCACGGNWVHRECSFGFDVDAPASKSASVLCCRLCSAAGTTVA